MKTFKTPKGTELPLLDLRGKDYLQVPYRIQWFREEHPDWVIKTEFIRSDDQTTICKAAIYDDKGVLRSMAHKREDIKDFKDHLEKSETSAIGRALAMLGYGTQFALSDLDEGERLADSPLEPKKEQAYFGPSKVEGIIYYDPSFIVPAGKSKGKRIDEVPYDDLRGLANWMLDKKSKGDIISHGWMSFIAQVDLMAEAQLGDVNG